MKKLTLLLITMLTLFSVSAQQTVRLTVNGQGATKEEATANALRNAIEQSFGVFVSANTQILNDEVVKDEIATIASGNIQEYKELACITLPNGNQSVSLSATVSIGNLISYAKSKGSSAEFAGATFAMNMKMRELNKSNEAKALEEVLCHLKKMSHQVFDWMIDIKDPIVCNQGYKIPIIVTAKANNSSAIFHNTLSNTLKSLNLCEEEVDGYKRNGLEIYQLHIADTSSDFASYHYSKYWGRGNVAYKIWSISLRNNPADFIDRLNHMVNDLSSSYSIIVNGINNTPIVPLKIETSPIKLAEIDYSWQNHTGYLPNTKINIYNVLYNFSTYTEGDVFTQKVDIYIRKEDLQYIQGFEIQSRKQEQSTPTESDFKEVDKPSVNKVEEKEDHIPVNTVIEEEEPYIRAEQMPSFLGGDSMTFRNWLYMKIAKSQTPRNGVTGRVLFSFIIEKDGSVTNFNVISSPDSSLSNEVERVLKTSPRWVSGKQGGRAVRVKITLSIDFR